MTRYTHGIGSEGGSTADEVWSGKMMGVSDTRNAVKDFLLDEVT